MAARIADSSFNESGVKWFNRLSCFFFLYCCAHWLLCDNATRPFSRPSSPGRPGCATSPLRLPKWAWSRIWVIFSWSYWYKNPQPLLLRAHASSASLPGWGKLTGACLRSGRVRGRVPLAEERHRVQWNPLFWWASWSIRKFGDAWKRWRAENHGFAGWVCGARWKQLKEPSEPVLFHALDCTRWGQWASHFRSIVKIDSSCVFFISLCSPVLVWGL